MVKDMKQSYRDQGHFNTGAGIRSIDFRIERDGTSLVGIVEFHFYMAYLNTGIPASRIPFQRGSGRKSSKYIDALVDYFRKKGLSPKDSKRAAFATATVHKKEGMPTRASRRFSKTGKRTGAADIAIQRTHPKLEREVKERIDDFVLASIDIPFQQLQNIG